MIRFRKPAIVPGLFAALTAAVGLGNLIAGVEPGRAPGELVLTTHDLVMPAGVALLVLSAFLARRRRRALWLTVALLAAVGLVELVRHGDLGEAALCWSLLALLVRGRGAFTVRHDRTTLRAAAGALGVAAVAGSVAVLAVEDWATSLLFAVTLAYCAYQFFRPQRDGHRPAGAHARRLVREHGTDTLSAFKLRPDLSVLVSEDGRALVSYRVHSGVLLIAGDPVGPREALPRLLREVRAFAAQRGLRVGAVGASEAFTALAREQGMRGLYLGDEAIVAIDAFTLEGKPIKKVRQAVNRVAREGFSATVHEVGALAPAQLEALETVSERWRDGAAERGFSMGMDGLRGEHVADSVVVVARDGEGAVRGFLHFVPVYGAPVMSLSLMRRDRDTPNGLTEFLIVRAIQLLAERGIEELSLNFALFARWMQAPANRLEQLLGRVVSWGNPYFQMESLYVFNAKFFPRWTPRYLLHDGAPAFVRTALAALWVEGQIPEPSWPRWPRPEREAPAAQLSAR